VSAATQQLRPKSRPPLSRGRGLAQQSLVEHALCPLDAAVSLQSGHLHVVQYHYTDANRNRKTATANVACPFGLSSQDEVYLYGLLALTFSQPEPTPDFYATPHWCLKQLGIVDAENEQGKRYQLFREAIRRLSGVVYQNDRFFDPVRGEHRDVAFGLLKYSLPIDSQSSRAWHFVWDQQFFRFAEAIRGSFAFDFALYRSLDPASRRLFLLLQKIFWRNDQSPAFELRQLGVNVLGFSDQLPTKEIKRKLIRTAGVLIEQEIIRLPQGTLGVKELFSKQAKGVHVVRFEKGAYFDRQPETAGEQESPLTEPLQALGFDRNAVARILKLYKPRLIQEWADITLAAVERKLIKQSPQAYFTHYIREAAANKTTPPDWWRALRKQEFERDNQSETREQRTACGEDAAFEEYLKQEGRAAFERVMSRLFESLKSAGQDEQDARRHAEYTARVHLRRQFREEHPELVDSGPVSLARLLQRHSR
jgi:hypothetical protein